MSNITDFLNAASSYISATAALVLAMAALRRQLVKERKKRHESVLWKVWERSKDRD